MCVFLQNAVFYSFISFTWFDFRTGSGSIFNSLALVLIICWPTFCFLCYYLLVFCSYALVFFGNEEVEEKDDHRFGYRYSSSNMG